MEKELILIAGPSAAGKTKYCESLENEGTVFIKTDAFNKQLESKYGINTEDDWYKIDAETWQQIVTERWQLVLAAVLEKLKQPDVQRV